jgi:hypothetical protein
MSEENAGKAGKFEGNFFMSGREQKETGASSKGDK